MHWARSVEVRHCNICSCPSSDTKPKHSSINVELRENKLLSWDYTFWDNPLYLILFLCSLEWGGGGGTSNTLASMGQLNCIPMILQVHMTFAVIILQNGCHTCEILSWTWGGLCILQECDNLQFNVSAHFLFKLLYMVWRNSASVFTRVLVSMTAILYWTTWGTYQRSTIPQLQWLTTKFNCATGQCTHTVRCMHTYYV